MKARSMVVLGLSLLAVPLLGLLLGHTEAAAAPVEVRRPTLTRPRSPQTPLLKIVFARRHNVAPEQDGLPPGLATDICVARHFSTGTEIQIVYTEPGDSCGCPRWSPDGQRIVFHGTGMEPANFDKHIFVMREDGGNLQQLTASELNDSSPAWSPDGDRIVWSREGDLWTMDVDGSNAEALLAEEGTHYGSPDWSPDGTRILCTAMDATNTPLIRVLQADGSGVTPVPAYGISNAMQPRWSPDGESIVVYSFAGRYWFLMGHAEFYGLYVMGADGSDGRWIVRPREVPSYSWTSPDWAPDGRKIICVLSSDVAQLQSMNLEESGDALLLTPSGIADRHGVSGLDVYVPEDAMAGNLSPLRTRPTVGPRIQR